MESLRLRVREGDDERIVASGDSSTLAIGRDPTARVRLSDDNVSLQHARLERRPDGWYFQDVGSRNGSQLDGVVVRPHTPVRLKHGAVLRLGSRTDIIVEVVDERRPEPAPRPAPPTPVLPQHDGRRATGAPRPRAPLTISTGIVRAGRALDNDLVFDEPHVSSYHLAAWLDGDGVGVKDLGSSNGTFVDGRRIEVATVPMDGAVRLGPSVLLPVREIAARLTGTPTGSWYSRHADAAEPMLAGRSLSRVVGGRKKILQEVDICVHRGQFVAVVGASGAGKSTLMRILNGYDAPSAGTLRAALNDVGEQEIGYVPQDDIIHRELPLKDAIVLSAMLRYPPGTSRRTVAARAEEVLKELALSEHARTRVARLSGGQRKRASVALELMTKPRLLLLDEATSGLDPATDRKLMHLLRGLADRSGIGIVLITHATANIAVCDTVTFLAPGGYQVFWGSPDEAAAFFGTDTFDQVYDKLEAEDTPAAWRKRFEGSANYLRLQAGTDGALRDLEAAARRPHKPPPSAALTLRWQLSGLTHRYLRTLFGDRRNVLFLLLQVPVLVLVAYLLFNQRNVLVDATYGEESLQLLFILSLVLIWAGAFNAAREICKERAIWERERHVGMQPVPYVLSKVAVLGALCALQAASAIFLLSLFWAAPEGGQAFGRMVVVGLLAALSGTALGLTLSASVATPDRAMALLPLFTVPQLMFGGLLVPLEEMQGPGAAIAAVMSSRWVFAAMASVTDRKEYIGPALALYPQVDDFWLRSVVVLVAISLALVVVAVWQVGRGGGAARTNAG